jgi:hypothetical protein
VNNREQFAANPIDRRAERGVEHLGVDVDRDIRIGATP